MVESLWFHHNANVLERSGTFLFMPSFRGSVGFCDFFLFFLLYKIHDDKKDVDQYGDDQADIDSASLLK